MLLALDTSTAQVGLGLFDGTQVLAESTWHSSLRHTQELAPALAELLRRVELKVDQIEAIGVATGPGSFTSLRVGLSFAKGMALARHIPLIGIPSLDVTAAGVPLADLRLIAVVHAGRGRLGIVRYQRSESGWVSESIPEVITAEELADKIHKPVFICGELTAEDRQRLARKFKNVTLASPSMCVRRPAILAELAWRKWKAGEIEPAASLAPIYLHVAGGLPA
jgi:tRNA threonylcarbamoyladenosine biosynthesis protein TsaB